MLNDLLTLSEALENGSPHFRLLSLISDRRKSMWDEEIAQLLA